MDNASKALVIAGGILISTLVISICMYMYTSFKVAYSDSLVIHDALEIEAFNSFFTSFPETLDGWEAYNIVGKIADVNASENALTTITLTGAISEEDYKETTFYFTEALQAEDAYTYYYDDTDADGLIDYIEIY